MVKKQKIYIETSVVSYLVSATSKNLVIAAHQASTVDMWKSLEKFDVFVSDLVIQEASKGDKEQAKKRLTTLKKIPLLKIDNEVKELAKVLLTKKAVPKKYPEDALHIAVAVANGIDIIVTWNFKHINNPFKKKTIRDVIESKDIICPEICSPDEIMGES